MKNNYTLGCEKKKSKKFQKKVSFNFFFKNPEFWSHRTKIPVKKKTPYLIGLGCCEAENKDYLPFYLYHHFKEFFKIDLSITIRNFLEGFFELSHLGAKYLVFVSSCSVKMRELSFAQFIYFWGKVCLFFNCLMIRFTITYKKPWSLKHENVTFKAFGKKSYG